MLAMSLNVRIHGNYPSINKCCIFQKTFALLESDLQCNFLNMFAFNILNIECSGMAKVSLNLWLVDDIVPEMQLTCIAVTLH